jgi:hypothetical protein
VKCGAGRRRRKRKSARRADAADIEYGAPMNSTLNPKQIDDPHDVLVVAPDVALVAPTEEELSRLAKMAQEGVRKPSDPQTPAASGLPVGSPVPPVDTTFRPAAVTHAQLSMGRRAAGAFTALLLAGCIGVAAVAWQVYRDAAKRMITKWAPQFVTSSLLLDKPGLSAQPAPPAVASAGANAAPPQPAALNQTAPQGVAPAAAAPPVESAQLLQSMARDVASLGQEVGQLKTSIEQLKASQQQISRDVAKVSEAKVSEAKATATEQNLRPRVSALPPRPAAARARKPVQPYYPPYPAPQVAAAPVSPPAAAPYYAPRQVEPQPQIAAEPPADPDQASAPRPPMPVR